MNRKTLAVLAIGLILGTGGAVLAAPYDVTVPNDYTAAMNNDLYNGNIPNGIPTPQSGKDPGHDLFNAANLLTQGTATPLVPNYATNQSLDNYIVQQASTFDIAKGSTFTFMVLGSSASNKNSVGLYLRNQQNAIVKQAPILSDVTGYSWTGNGSVAAPLQGAQTTAPAFSSTLGWYITAKDWKTNYTTEITYYSEAFLNPDKYDHLITYTLPVAGHVYNYIDPVSGIEKSYTASANAYLVGFKDRIAASGYDPLHPGLGVTMGDDDFNDVLILVDQVLAPGYTPTTKAPLVPEPGTIVLMGAGLTGLLVMRRRNRR